MRLQVNPLQHCRILQDTNWVALPPLKSPPWKKQGCCWAQSSLTCCPCSSVTGWEEWKALQKSRGSWAAGWPKPWQSFLEITPLQPIILWRFQWRAQFLWTSSAPFLPHPLPGILLPSYQNLASELFLCLTWLQKDTLTLPCLVTGTHCWSPSLHDGPQVFSYHENGEHPPDTRGFDFDYLWDSSPDSAIFHRLPHAWLANWQKHKF